MAERSQFNRRALVMGAIGVSAAGALAACGSSDGGDQSGPGTSESAGASSAAVGASSVSATSGPPSVLPTYVPYVGAKPDFEPQNQYSVAGFLKFPNPPVEAAAGTPGTGGVVRVAVASQAGTPKPLGSNAWWKAVNQRLGVDLKLEMTPAAQYLDKVATIIAGGDIPDLMRLHNDVPNIDKLLPAKFAELGEHLSGDNVKKYACLANIPTESWKSAVFAGGLYGVPFPLLLVSSRLIGRADIMESLNLSPNVKSGDEFFELCKALTDEKKSRWAMAQPTVSGYIAEMAGVPNNWRVDGGKFTKDIEADEYVDALTFLKKMWDAGYFFPDSFSSSLNINQFFQGRRACLINSGGNGMVSTYNLFVGADKDLRMAFMPPPRFDGGGPARKWLGSGQYGITAINKDASTDRIDELLGILNVLAGPFGTTGYLLTDFGAEGIDYTRNAAAGTVAATAAAASEKIPVNYLPGKPSVYYSGGYPDVTKAACEYEALVTQQVEPYPTIGLLSETDLQKGSALTKAITSAAADVVQGRKQLSSWKDVVSAWRKGGGEQIRREYERAYAQSHQ